MTTTRFRSTQLTGTWVTMSLALAVGCNDDAPIPSVQSEAALTAFGTCQALEQYIEDTAVQEMRVTMDQWRDGWGWWGPVDFAAEAGAERATAPTQGSRPTDFTKTNTQVEGVDEADFMKTDGTRIFVLSGRKLYQATSWPPQDLAVTRSLELEGWPLEMFLDESGRIIVFSSWWPQFDDRNDIYCGPWGCGGYQTYTRVAVINTSDRGLEVEREAFFPGSYVSSRRIGSSVRLVLREQLGRPADLRYWPESFRGDRDDDREELEAAMEALKARNETLIRNQELSDWLPRAFLRADGIDTDLQRSCGSFNRPNAPVRLGLTTIATLDLSNASAPSLQRTSVLGEVGEIYASQSSLYLASPHWWWRPQAGQSTHTYIHKFDISDSQRAIYAGSGGVPGYLLDQFSMDEHLGYLRVATTIATWRTSFANGWERETSNQVSVLGAVRGRLVSVGEVTGIAPSEQITSARFVGNRGFVVTFEQVDPLFTLDLTNPFAPSVVGELKVPGFSSYIHPLDENHLLTIGVDLPEPDANGRVDWSQRAMKLTVFDVSNFAQPREKFTQRVGTAYGWSEAGWNHKAFNWFPARNMLAVPFSDYVPTANNYWDSFVSDLRLFEVDVDQGIRFRGSLDLGDLYVTHAHQDWTWRYSPWVRRSVMADDYAYAISDAGIRVADMRNPQATIATALFDTVRTE